MNLYALDLLFRGVIAWTCVQLGVRIWLFWRSNRMAWWNTAFTGTNTTRFSTLAQAVAVLAAAVYALATESIVWVLRLPAEYVIAFLSAAALLIIVMVRLDMRRLKRVDTEILGWLVGIEVVRGLCLLFGGGMQV